jgi:phage minor structural protein
LIVTNLAGTSEIITDYTNLTRKKRVNGEQSISFLLLKTDRNSHSFDLVSEESIVEYDSIEYRIKGLVERTEGKPIKSITAYHTFFDIVDEYRYTTLTTGFKSINTVLSFIFSGLDWTFSVIDSFSAVEFENFGNENCLSLFQKVIDRYQAEFEIIGNDVRIKKKIGSTADFQFRYGYNIKTFKRNVNTSNLSTYIKGTGKLDEDENPIVSAEYTSPMSEVYGIRHAPPYSNEAITNYDTLVEYLRAKLQDTPEISIELEFVSLQEQGYTSVNPNIGDTVPTIYEPLNIDVDLRIVESEDYPESKKSPKVTLSTTPKSFVKSVMDYQKSLLDKIYDENIGKLKYNVYDEAVKKATEALNNSLTQLEYPENMGILARDPDDPNKITVFRSEGIGISSDNGVTFKTAVYSGGIVTDLLTAGQIKTNNIQIIGNDDLFYWDGNYLIAIDAADANKFVRLKSGEIYIAKGAMVIERPDGYKVVNNGILSNSFAIQGSTPTFKTAGVEESGQFFRTSAQNRYENVQRFVFKHDSRYLRIICNMSVDGGVDFGNVGSISFDVLSDDESTSIASVTVTETRKHPDQGYRKDILVDLGVPTGNILVCYWRMYSSLAYYTYGSVRYIVQEG